MGAILIAFVVIAVVFFFLILFVIGQYNQLVTLRNRFKNAFSQIDVQLKRRYDLIPNLVATVKGYAAHESGTLEAVVQARNAALGAQGPAQQAAAEQQLSGALGRLIALGEAYPDLKANQNMLALQEELSSTENKVAFSRQAFNDTVMSFNNARENFPNNLIANFFNFKPAELLEIEAPEKRAVPDVSFT